MERATLCMPRGALTDGIVTFIAITIIKLPRLATKKKKRRTLQMLKETLAEVLGLHFRGGIWGQPLPFPGGLTMILRK